MADARTLDVIKEHLGMDLPGLYRSDLTIKEQQQQELREMIKRLEDTDKNQKE